VIRKVTLAVLSIIAITSGLLIPATLLQPQWFRSPTWRRIGDTGKCYWYYHPKFGSVKRTYPEPYSEMCNAPGATCGMFNVCASAEAQRALLNGSYNGVFLSGGRISYGRFGGAMKSKPPLTRIAFAGCYFFDSSKQVTDIRDPSGKSLPAPSIVYFPMVCVEIPLAIVLLLSAPYPIIAFARGPLRRWRRRRVNRRREEGLCISCGYDLTGNVTGRCPECGTEIES